MTATMNKARESATPLNTDVALLLLDSRADGSSKGFGNASMGPGAGTGTGRRLDSEEVVAISVSVVVVVSTGVVTFSSMTSAAADGSKITAGSEALATTASAEEIRHCS